MSTRPWFIRQETGDLLPCSPPGELHALASVAGIALIGATIGFVASKVFEQPILIGVISAFAWPVLSRITRRTVPANRVIDHTDPRVHETGMALRRNDA